MQALQSGASRVRLDAVHAFLTALDPAQEVLLVGATRGAVDDCARALARRRGVTFGIHRLSLTQLAARLALRDLATRQLTPVTALASQGFATRAVFDAAVSDTLEYFRPVRHTPGFARALTATLGDLRLHAVRADALASLPRGGADLGDLYARVEALLDAAGASDQATLFEAALAALDAGAEFAGVPVVLLDVALDAALPARFALAVARRAPRALIVIPAGDTAAAAALAREGIALESREEDGGSDLHRLQRHLFDEAPPPPRQRHGELAWFSAPGEARECVEIARRLRREAASGVPFDAMAVLLRSPAQYTGVLEQALARAGVPAYFDRGTRRPDPAGRAFLALLGCAVEDLSATRFAEYVSLGQVPTVAAAAPAVADVPPDAEPLELAAPTGEPARLDTDAPADVALIATPAMPWKWERLLVDSAVIGGAERWTRRLHGLAAEFNARIRGLADENPDDPRIDRLRRELDQLRHLQGFALPIIETLQGWSDRVTWGEWLERLQALAAQALSRADHVVQVLRSLRPMAGVGPVGIDEVRSVLLDRLRTLDAPSPEPRYGKVFVAATEQARGRLFRVVFIPGLAERAFPKAIREDPLLGDDVRAVLPGLPRQHERSALERLRLRLAVGAATDRVYVSFPRVDASTGRGRVPSFYALELMRAVTGAVPDHVALSQEAAAATAATLAWPAPAAPADAIDDVEHDLSVLRALMKDPVQSRGRAHYLVQLNPHLRRSLAAQWQRARARWTSFDGLVQVTDPIRPFLATQRLHERPYSVSALQQYAVCPYRFLLSAIYRFAPVDVPARLERLDPLTRGSLVHRIQAELFRALDRASLLPPRRDAEAAIVAALERTIAAVAAEFAEQLAPAFDRIWRDELAAIGRDLHVWLDAVLDDPDWDPWRVEYAFGLPDRDGNDPHSLPDPVTVGGRFRLRGAIDLIERRRGGASLRVTDYKTSRNRLAKQAVLGGGTALQPVLYSLAAEAATGAPVERARFWFCTTAGSFSQHDVPIGDRERRAGVEVLELVDRAVELGLFPAAPAPNACATCDFHSVCGPQQDRRVRHKPQDLLGDVIALRARP